MNLQTVTCSAIQPPALRQSASVEDFSIRHLKTFRDIEDILYLREEIDLSVHSATGPEFLELEKKETNAALSAPSNYRGRS